MNIEEAQKAQVRWMGMIVAVFILLLGAFLTLMGAMMAAVGVFAAFTKPAASAPRPALDLFLVSVNVLLGIPLFLYGRSMFRRARTDPVVIAVVAVPATPGSRSLAWLGVGFSSLVLLGALVVWVAAVTRGEPVPPAIGGLMWFAVVLVASIRHLRKPRGGATGVTRR